MQESPARAQGARVATLENAAATRQSLPLMEGQHVCTAPKHKQQPAQVQHNHRTLHKVQAMLGPAPVQDHTLAADSRALCTTQDQQKTVAAAGSC